jgi:hypothetical protein
VFLRMLALGLLLIGYAGLAGAQAIPAGTRIRYEPATPRVARPPSTKGWGTVVGQQGDTLVIRRAASDTVRVALSAIRHLDVWHGRSHFRGALKGVGFGVGIGLALGSAHAMANRRQELAVLAVPIFGFIGAVTGTLVGAAVGSERWHRVVPVR